MQMRHQPGLVADQHPQRLVHAGGVQRGQPQPRQLRHQRKYPPHQLPQPRPPRQVGTVAGHVHAGQHHLGVAGRRQRAHLVHHRAHRHAAVRPAAERDDAEGAAVVAALLHGDVGARPAAQTHHRMGHRCTRLHDVAMRRASTCRPRSGLKLLLVAEHARHPRQARPPLRRDLRGTPSHHDRPLRPLPMRTRDRPPRVPLRLAGDRARVDHQRVGQLRGMAADDLALEGVQPAAERQYLGRHAP